MSFPYSLLLVPPLCYLPSHFQLNSRHNRASKLVRVVLASSPRGITGGDSGRRDERERRDEGEYRDRREHRDEGEYRDRREHRDEGEYRGEGERRGDRER